MIKSVNNKGSYIEKYITGEFIEIELNTKKITISMLISMDIMTIIYLLGWILDFGSSSPS